jgi:hypothetical protein
MAAVFMSVLTSPAGAALYPSSPFPVTGPVTLLQSGEVEDARSLTALWLGQPGVPLRQLAPRFDGSWSVARSVPLPPGAVPVAVGNIGGWADDYLFVLDAASEAVLVYPPSGQAAGEAVRMPVGSRPTAMVVTFRSLVVANSGSNDLSVYTWKVTDSGSVEAFSAEQRFPAGSGPRALAPVGCARRCQWAVANAQSGTISVLDSRFARVADISVGGAPTSVRWTRVGGRGRADLVVGDATAPSVRVVLGTPSGWRAGPTLVLRNSSGPASPIGVRDLTGDDRPDIVVGDPSRSAVVLFRGRGRGRFAPGRDIASGVTPQALQTGRFGGDYTDDVAILDSSTNAVRLLLTPGDPLVAAEAQADLLEAGRGVVVWSHSPPGGLHRLAVRRDGATLDLPGVTAARPIVARVGRLQGRPAVAYVACSKRACTPYVHDLASGRRQRLAIHAPGGCAVRAVAVWDSWLAYEIGAGGDGRCTPRQRGIHVRRHGSGVITRLQGTLGDLRNGWLAWLAYWPAGDGKQIRVARVPGHRVRTLERVDIDCHCWLEPPRIEGRHVVYGINNDDEYPVGANLRRTRLDRRPSCRQSFVDNTAYSAIPPIIGWNVVPEVRYAVSGNRVFYIGDQNIFQVARERLRWKPKCR